jgi:hypothetical protein
VIVARREGSSFLPSFTGFVVVSNVLLKADFNIIFNNVSLNGVYTLSVGFRVIVARRAAFSFLPSLGLLLSAMFYTKNCSEMTSIFYLTMSL